METLTVLLADRRHLTAQEIAIELSREYGVSISRNSVISKLTRSGLSLPNAVTPLTPEQKAERDRKRAERKAKPRRNFAPPKYNPGNPAERFKHRQSVDLVPLTTHADDLAIPEGQRRSILTVAERECRWPVGHVGEPGFFLCGAPTAIGEAYCPSHRARSVQCSVAGKGADL